MGSGLGLFGCRYNKTTSKDLRSTPGRYIGKAKDSQGRDCFVMVLSTREQHIRKEKATSNVCSNQAFLASLAGANLLAKGERGLQNSLSRALKIRNQVAGWIAERQGVELAYPHTPAFNDLLFSTEDHSGNIINEAASAGIHLGVEVLSSPPEATRKLYKMSFSDIHDDQSLQLLKDFIYSKFPAKANAQQEHCPPTTLLRSEPVHLPSFSHDELLAYYHQLADLNVSPDDGCYPLGSCTMKYNPLLNDWAASLDGFAMAHPQSPEKDAQGPLEVLFEIQEWFKSITGLAAVTTQPVAGAQGGISRTEAFSGLP